MAASKKYAGSDFYERKLVKIMERFEATDCNYNWDRHAAWIEFRMKGQLYRFDHSLENANKKGRKLSYGSDVFAEIVLALEDLARIQERGIYELSQWLSGMKFLPPVVDLPSCFKILGFVEMPADESQIDTRYKALAKQYHPDKNKDPSAQDDFISLQRATEQAKKHFMAGKQK